MEISHKILGVLLIVAIVVSVGGAFWNIDRIGKIALITGKGSSGFVNLTVNTLTSINITATDCDFGSGYINVGSTSALLESNGTVTNWSGAGTVYSLVVRNDGNKNITVNVSSGKTLSDFYGGNCSGGGCTYQFWSADNESGSCVSGLVAYPGANMDTTNITACSEMDNLDGTDELLVHCRLALYQSIPVGAKTDTWTFWATSL